MKAYKIIAISFLLVGFAWGQTTTFKAKQGLIEKIWGFLKKPISTVTYTLSNGTVAADGKAALDLYISTNRMSPVGLQWEISYDSTVVESLSVVAGPVALAAGKDVQCEPLTATLVRCIVVGMNQNPIQNGVAAIITVNTHAGTTVSSTTVSLSSPVTVSKKATALISAIAPGGGTVTFPVVLANLTCPVTEIEPNEDVTCTVSLSRNAVVDTVVQILYEDAFLTGPASVVILAGQSSISVMVTGQ